MRAWHHLYPALPAFYLTEQARAGIGALLGIGLCVLAITFLDALGGPVLFLVAPLGATAVLVFCVPNSPLAQPWSAIIGNVISALIALLVVSIVPAPWAAGVAVGGAIAAMMLVRALHPPGGAVALLVALDPALPTETDPVFALLPVGLTTTILVIAAIGYNRLTGRVYPFRQPATDETEDPAPRIGLTNDQLEALLEQFNQATNLGVADLGRLLAAAEAEAAQHRFDRTLCSDIMTTELVTVRPDTTLTEAVRLFRQHAIKCLPVVQDDMRLTGLVLQADLLTPVTTGRLTVRGKGSASRTVSEVMHPADRAVPQDLPVGTLLNRLAAQGTEVVPIQNAGRLVGILTRSDIIRLLLSGAEERTA
jgi:CBS domain-containing membrane protein